MSTHPTPTRYGFLLCPNFTLIALSSAVEPLRMANRISGRSLYEYTLFSFDGKEVRSSGGLDLAPVSKLTDREQLDALFFCAGTIGEVENTQKQCFPDKNIETDYLYQK